MSSTASPASAPTPCRSSTPTARCSASSLPSTSSRRSPAPATSLQRKRLVHEAPELRVDQSLEDAVRALAATDDDGLPVLDAEARRVGWLTHRRLLRAYHARLQDRPGAGQTAGSIPPESEI